MEEDNELSAAMQAQFEAKPLESIEIKSLKPKLVEDPNVITLNFEEKLDFPPGTPEEVRLQVCHLLDKKDKEIKQLNKEVDKLEVKYNGSLTHAESENLKTEMNKAIYLRSAIERELYKIHYRAIMFEPTSGVLRPFDIKLEKVPLWERFKKFVANLIPFEIKRKQIPQ